MKFLEIQLFFTLCQLLSITSQCNSVNFTKKLKNKRKQNFFTFMAASAYHVIWKRVENHIFRHNWISGQTCMLNKPHWQSREILIFLSKYCIVISNTLVGPFLDVLFVLLPVILSELHEKSRRKDWVTAKSK